MRDSVLNHHCEEKLKILTKQSRTKILRLPRSFQSLAMTILLYLTFFSLTSYAKPKIVVSITPIASIVSMLVKDKADIESLAISSDCPHHYNIKPSDLVKVKNADIAIYINEQFDGFAEKLIDNHSKNIIKISDIKSLTIIKDIVKSVGFNYKERGAKPITNRRATSDDGSEFKSFDYNWHIWLDLDNVRILLQEFARIFSKNFPELQEDINNNLSAALKELNKLQEIKNNEFATIKDVILLSDSSEYFFVNTNIKTSKLYSESQKSLRYIRKLEDLIKESNNKCLVLSSEQNSRLYDKLNAKIIILNSENWNVKNINSSTFQNQYLQMINQVKKCLY
ncbi:metal ABC transporter substrate-binding protein [Rickettsia felis]|uniref:Zinc/manganese ABC transporter substrate binding protein n=3 Tax=Rickettsia felis TaxID=42862 RepID=Q4UNI8_RICFE|nr:metal ABC transporter substrate-binding protein [Rickettsia felis]AAY60869.1 Zinc/manganese ABC transporter substrate binding protein [Rickettsia felis URRWXCal2]MDE8611549.1 metal ABC transporter substrate-binding protein [Rickettsia felis]